MRHALTFLHPVDEPPSASRVHPALVELRTDGAPDARASLVRRQAHVAVLACTGTRTRAPPVLAMLQAGSHRLWGPRWSRMRAHAKIGVLL